MLNSLRLALLLVLLTGTPAYAAPEGGGGGLLDINTGLMVWTAAIFLIVLFLLIKFAFPHILGAVEAREARIREMLEQAERDRAEAAALVEENRRALEETRRRVQEALAEGRGTAEKMREEILAQARREQEDIVARARRDIQAERAAALESVRRDAVDLAIAAAERLVRRNLTAEDNRRMVLDYLGQVEAQRAPAATGA